MTFDGIFMQFEWGENKNKINLEKRAIDFTLATEIFSDDMAVETTRLVNGEEGIQIIKGRRKSRKKRKAATYHLFVKCDFEKHLGDSQISTEKRNRNLCQFSIIKSRNSFPEKKEKGNNLRNRM